MKTLLTNIEVNFTACFQVNAVFKCIDAFAALEWVNDDAAFEQVNKSATLVWVNTYIKVNLASEQINMCG